MIHTAKDGRKWAVLEFATGTHLVGEDGSLSSTCVAGSGLPIVLGVDSAERHAADYPPGDGRPLCPACCRAAIRMGLLEDPAPGRVLKKGEF